jgi:hypothetical protein
VHLLPGSRDGRTAEHYCFLADFVALGRPHVRVRPGFCLRLIVLAYSRNDPRRAELIAELYAVPRIQRPFWVAEQLEVALFEGVVQRLKAAPRRTRRRQQITVGAAIVVVVAAASMVLLGTNTTVKTRITGSNQMVNTELCPGLERC